MCRLSMEGCEFPHLSRLVLWLQPGAKGLEIVVHGLHMDPCQHSFDPLLIFQSRLDLGCKKMTPKVMLHYL